MIFCCDLNNCLNLVFLTATFIRQLFCFNVFISYRFYVMALFFCNRLFVFLFQTADLQNTNNSCTNLMQRKLVSSHQMILQGLQAYLSHMQSTLPNIVTGKIKELIEKSSNLCEIHLKLLNSNSRDSIHNINEDIIHVSDLLN